MSVLDVVIFMILAIAAVRGFRNGLVIEVLGLASIIIAGYAAYYLSEPMAKVFGWNFGYGQEMAFVIIFIVVIFTVVYIAQLISRMFSAVGLGLGNQLGGAVVAIFKYIIIVSVVLSIFMSMNTYLKVVTPEKMNNTLLYKPLMKVSDYLFPYYKIVRQGIRKVINE